MFFSRRLCFIVPLAILGCCPSAKCQDSINIETPNVVFGETLTISSVVIGRIKAISVEEGASVDRGMPLVQLDDAELQAKLRFQAEKSESLEAEKYAEAVLQQTEFALSNAEKANRELNGLFSPVEVEKRRNDRLTAVRDLALKRKERVLAGFEKSIIEEELKNLTMYAPANCFVRKRLLGVGATVQPNTPILELVVLNSLRVEGYVRNEAVSSLRKGMSITVRSGDNIVTAQLAFIDVSSQTVRQQVRVWGTIEDSTKIRPGERITAQIEVRSSGSP